MSNALGNYDIPLYANEGVISLWKALGMGNRVYRGFDEERRSYDKGSVINIRRPSTFVAEDAPGTAQDLNTESIAMTLNRWKTVKAKMNDKEVAFADRRIIDEHIPNMAYALADAIDQDLVALYKDVPWTVDQVGSTMGVADITNAYQTLFDNQAPMKNEANLHFMIGGVEQNALTQLSAFSQWQGAGQSGVATQESGQIMRKFGFNFFANQNRPTHTAGVAADSTGTLTGAHAKGATSIAVAAVTNSSTYKKGDTLVIASNSQRYSITADATADGSGNVTLSVFPALVAAYSNGAVVTIDLQAASKAKQNIAFHSEAFAFASARLPDYRDRPSKLGIDAFSVQDPVTGLALRARMFYVGDSSELFFALDVLYAVKTLNANLAMRSRAA